MPRPSEAGDGPGAPPERTSRTERTGPTGPRDAEPGPLIDQCLLVGMPGSRPDPQFQRWLEAGLAGVLLFRDNIVDQARLAELTAELAQHRAGVIVAADEEGGDITRLHAREGSPHPGNLALGAIDDTALTRAIAADIGAELRAAGVGVDLAPSVDVQTDPNNPIIGTRSFGAYPELVARHTTAYVDGLHDAGVAACAKHFPGHGDTNLDSHHDLPTITGDLAPHLYPFRAAIEAGVDAILTAHIVFPALDDQPATLSPRILSELLRVELGFEGAIVTDSMSMGAIVDEVGLAEGSLRALLAGADLLCMNSSMDDQLGVRRYLMAAVEDGRLPIERLHEAARRVRRLAEPRAQRSTVVPRQWDTATARSALLVDGVRLPLPTPPYVVEVAAPRRGVELSAGSLLAHLQYRDTRTDGVRLHAPDADRPVDLDGALAAAAESPLLLVVRDAHRDPGQREIVARAREHRPDVVVVGIGTTADAGLAPGGYLGTRGGACVNLATAADALLGVTRPRFSEATSITDT